MKRIICLFAALALLCVSCASAESAASVAPAPTVTLDVQRDGTSLVFTSPDFPGLAITLSENDAEAVPLPILSLLLSFTPDRPAELVRRFFAALDAWAGMQADTAEESGVYAGDAFLKARTKKSFEVSAEELRSFEAMINPDDPFFRQLSALPAAEGQSLAGAVYDNGKYYSADLMNGEDCVMTVSADLTDPDDIYLVCGLASGGAYYYNEFRAVRDGSGTAYFVRLYRGEEAFFSPEEQVLCQSLEAVFTEEGEKQEFAGTVDSLLLDTAVRFEGTVADVAKVSVPEGKMEISTSGLFEFAALWLQFNPRLNVLDLVRTVSE